MGTVAGHLPVEESFELCPSLRRGKSLGSPLDRRVQPAQTNLAVEPDDAPVSAETSTPLDLHEGNDHFFQRDAPVGHRMFGLSNK